MTLKNSIKEFGDYLGENESILDKDYKRIADRIELHWGYEEFYPFMNKLFVNEFDRDRAGFSPLIIQELYELSEIHDRLFPGKRKQVKSVFNR